MAAAYSSLAREAIERRDAATLQQAVEAWGELQPFQAQPVRLAPPAAGIREELAELHQAQDSLDELAARMEELKTKYPDLVSRVDEIGQEAAEIACPRAALGEDGDTRERVQRSRGAVPAGREPADVRDFAAGASSGSPSSSQRKRDELRQQAQVASSGRGSVAEPEAAAQQDRPWWNGSTPWI